MESVQDDFYNSMQRWVIDVEEWNLSSDKWEILLSLLPESERSRVKRFVRENDRRLALASRLLQRALVSKVFSMDFSRVEVGRTRENKPYFSGLGRALQEESKVRLRNWNFNVSHHGRYAVIASEPVCLCGVDLVDTAGRRNRSSGGADEYLQCFTSHFTDEEWEAICSFPDDESRLREFYINWGLKESFIKAVGQGLGFELRRVSFSCLGREDGSCEEQNHPAQREYKVKVDGNPRVDWVFRSFDLGDGYVACVARGPPSACCDSGLAAGIIMDFDLASEVLEEGLRLPQPGFRLVTLEELLPVDAWRAFCAAD